MLELLLMEVGRSQKNNNTIIVAFMTHSLCPKP